MTPRQCGTVLYWPNMVLICCMFSAHIHTLGYNTIHKIERKYGKEKGKKLCVKKRNAHCAVMLPRALKIVDIYSLKVGGTSANVK